MDGVRRYWGGTASRAQQDSVDTPSDLSPASTTSSLPPEEYSTAVRSFTPPHLAQHFARLNGFGSPSSPSNPGSATRGFVPRPTKDKDPSSSTVRFKSNTASSMAATTKDYDWDQPRSPPITTSTSSSPPKSYTSRKDTYTNSARPTLPPLSKNINGLDNRYGSPIPSTSNSATGASTTWNNVSTLLNTRDDLLMGLLASQAMVESQEAEILSAEEVDELKREHALLTSRVAALTKRVAIETKIRDAAQTLSRLNENIGDRHTTEQTTEQLQAANRKVDSARHELWSVSERANDAGRRLLEHRAAILSFSVRKFERQEAKSTAAIGRGRGIVSGNSDSTDESEFNSARLSNGETSPASTTATSLSFGAPREKFGAAHFFAGHADAVVPMSNRDLAAALKEAEEKLKTATEELVPLKKQCSAMKTEITMLGLEKTEMETNMGLELQNAEETILNLEQELQALDQDRTEWETSRRKLETRTEELQLKNSQLEEGSPDARAAMEALQVLCETNQIKAPPVTGELMPLVVAVEKYIVEEKRSNAGMTSELTKQVDDAKKEARLLEARLKEEQDRQYTPPPIPSIPLNTYPPATPNEEYDRLLKPLWAILPSVEARAQKLGPALRNPRSPKPVQFGNVKSPEHSPSLSLSELDVRSLKSLYNGPGSYTSPGLSGEFTLEEFAQRVQALVQDDRALVERLIRFAGAHDLLKTNAERAQKLAHDSTSGLETYQKQVRTLEERNASLMIKQTALLDEIDDLQVALEKIEVQRRELEERAAEQAETCKSLTEANNTLSAKTLTLAAEAAVAPEAIKSLQSQKAQIESAKGLAETQLKKVEAQNKALESQISRLESQMAETSKALREANSDLDLIRMAENSQRIALLDELNAMQQENGALRNQLRAARQG